MKKTNFKRIVSFILMLVMLMGLVSINVFAAGADEQSTDPSVEITGRNVMYGDYFYLMYAVEASNVPDGAEIAIDLALAGSPISATYEYIDTDEEVEKYGLPVGMHMFIANTGVAAHAAETVYTAKAKIVNGDTVVAESAVCEYSILEYMYQRLYTVDGLDAADVALYESYLAFAAAAEAKFDEAANQVIASSVYVCSEKLTFNGGDTAGTFVKGTTLTNFAPTVEVPEGYFVTYKIESFDGAGIVVKTAEEMNAGYVLDTNCRITAVVEEIPSEEIVETTVTVNIADYAAANGWVNDTKYTTLNMNDNITVTVDAGGNTGKYYTNGNNWRIYQANPNITVSAKNGEIISVKITYSVSNTGVLLLGSTQIASGSVVPVNASSVDFKVGNTGTATNGQVRITAIEVVYGVEAHECNYSEATCTELATCTICGATTGELAPHSWNDATCEAAKTCSVCGATEGDKLPHTDVNPVDHNCDVCGAENVTDHVDADGDTVCDNGCSVEIPSGSVPEEPAVEEHTVSMNIFGTTGTKSSDTVIYWAQGDVTVTNDKASSTTAIRTSDSDHYRIYGKSTLTISANGGAIKQIIITCESASYATVMNTTATNAGLTSSVNGSVVTITVDSAESVTMTLSAQARFNKVEVTYDK